MITAFSTKLINVATVALAGTAILFGACSGDACAATKLVAQVSISQQRMMVLVDGRTAFRWKVSTGARGHATPKGSYRPVRLEAMWYSRKYDNAPMPHSVFFHEGYAVHATNHVKRLGMPASHGCVRLHPAAAADFYQLVETFGTANTSIVIVE